MDLSQVKYARRAKYIPANNFLIGGVKSFLAITLIIFLTLVLENSYVLSSVKKPYSDEENKNSQVVIEKTKKLVSYPVPEDNNIKKKLEDVKQGIGQTIKEKSQPSKKKKTEEIAYNLNNVPGPKSSKPAGYLITLINGSQFKTNYCWKNDAQISFIYNGDIVGIPENSIKIIDKSQKFYRENVLTVEKVLLPSAQLKKKAFKEVKMLPAVNENKKKNIGFMTDFSLLKKRFNDTGVMTVQELYQFSKDLVKMRNQIFNARLGNLYAGQIRELYSMLDEIEYLIAREIERKSI